MNRWSLLALLIATSLLTSGCRSTWRNPFGPPPPQSPVVIGPGMPLEQITEAVNANAAKIRSIQTNNASITLPGMLGIPTLRGNIAAERPGRIRLEASTALTGKEVDLGSNDELFWLWVRQNQPPAVYYAKHDQFVGSAAQQIMPIQPEWLLDAMGFAEFKPTDFHEGPFPQADGKLEIKSVINTRMGQLTKRTWVDGQRALVLQQHVYDASGKLLASTVAQSHQYYPALGISLPQKITVQMPAADLSLTIDMGTVVINQVAANPQLWEMPMPAGYPPVDLGNSNGAAPSFGRQLSRGDWYTPTSPATPAMIAALPQPTPSPMTAQPNSAPAFGISPYSTPQSASPVVGAGQSPPMQQLPVQQLPVQRLPPGGVPQAEFSR